MAAATYRRTGGEFALLFKENPKFAEKLKEKKYRMSEHASVRSGERRVTTEEIIRVLDHGKPTLSKSAGKENRDEIWEIEHQGIRIVYARAMGKKKEKTIVTIIRTKAKDPVLRDHLRPTPTSASTAAISTKRKGTPQGEDCFDFGRSPKKLKAVGSGKRRLKTNIHEDDFGRSPSMTPRGASLANVDPTIFNRLLEKADKTMENVNQVTRELCEFKTQNQQLQRKLDETSSKLETVASERDALQRQIDASSQIEQPGNTFFEKLREQVESCTKAALEGVLSQPRAIQSQQNTSSVASDEPYSLDFLTVSALKTVATNHGVEIPTKMKKESILSTLKLQGFVDFVFRKKE